MAVQFPPQLFQNIIHFLTGGDMSFFPEENYRRGREPTLELSKREFGACSLVCRYWAQHIRPKIFGRPTIRSRDDFLALIALAKSEIWPIGSGFRGGMYVEHLSLKQDIHSPSCIDLLFHIFPRHLFPHLASNNSNSSYVNDCIRVIFNGTGDSERSGLEDKLKCCAPRTIYHGLPYQLPLPLSPVYEVYLQNAMFCSFNSFISFISDIAAKRLTIVSVHFMDTEPFDPHIPPNILQTKPRQIPVSVIVRNCSLFWPLIWTITTCRAPLVNKFWRRGYTPAVYISPSELAKLATLVKCVFDDCKCILCSRQSSTGGDAGTRVFRVTGPNLDKLSDQRSPEFGIVIFKHDVYKYIGLVVAHRLDVVLSPQGFVTALVLEFYSQDKDHDTNPFSRPRALNINWRTIDTLASQLTTSAPNPWALEIHVSTKSMDDMCVFVPYVRSQMLLMRTAGRLAFGFGRTEWVDVRPWIPWREELEPVEAENDGADVETGSTAETAVVE